MKEIDNVVSKNSSYKLKEERNFESVFTGTTILAFLM